MLREVEGACAGARVVIGEDHLERVVRSLSPQRLGDNQIQRRLRNCYALTRDLTCRVFSAAPVHDTQKNQTRFSKSIPQKNRGDRPTSGRRPEVSLVTLERIRKVEELRYLIARIVPGFSQSK